MFRESKSTRAGERSGDTWGAAYGACEKNMSMLFLDRASAKMFCLPEMCVTVNQKSNFADKKTSRRMKTRRYM